MFRLDKSNIQSGLKKATSMQRQTDENIVDSATAINAYSELERFSPSKEKLQGPTIDL